MKYQLISTLDVSDGDRFYEPRKFIHWKKCLKQNVAPRAVYRDTAQAVGGTNVTLPHYSQIVISTNVRKVTLTMVFSLIECIY